MNFTKPAINVDEQVALLRRRGLSIPDEKRARHYLQFVGYYRLAGYALPFQVDYNDDGTHRFCDGATFEDILNVYVFDRENQKPIAAAFGMDPKILASWLHALSYLRNLAAHHQRLWNRVYTITPIAAKRYRADLHDGTRFYAQVVIIQALLAVISPNSGWGRRLSSLLDAYPDVPVGRLGFPSDWRSRHLWCSPNAVADTGDGCTQTPVAR